MTVPICRLCGKGHYAYQPHQWPKAVLAEMAKRAEQRAPSEPVRHPADILQEMRLRSASNLRILGAIRGNEKRRARGKGRAV